ncbi:MAG: M56 family metallopeptidase [Gemmatimonadota bacterium]
MTAWMLYAVLLGGALAWTGEMLARVLRRRGRAERGIWVTALLGAAVMPFSFPFLPRLGPAAMGTVQLQGIVGSGSPGPAAPHGASIDSWIVALWGTAVLVMAVRMVWAARRLNRIVARSRTLRRWPVEVRATDATGPAVAGVFRPVILLPRTARERRAEERRWILLHELEHIRAGDPALVWLVLVSRCLLPWNPAIWYLGRRLREGLEFDCDRRVLARRPDPRSYGETLLTLVTPDRLHSLPVAAFREPLISLKRRFFSMTTPRRPLTLRTLALLGGTAAVALVGACEFSPVYELGEPTAAEAPAADREAAAEVPDAQRIAENPTFTPYTAAPDLVNRREVVAALEREYPRALRDAGVEGSAKVWLFIDADGELRDMRIQESSGHEALDDAALRVAASMRFSPAVNHGETVPVWVAFPITFLVR